MERNCTICVIDRKETVHSSAQWNILITPAKADQNEWTRALILTVSGFCAIIETRREGKKEKKKKVKSREERERKEKQEGLCAHVVHNWHGR